MHGPVGLFSCQFSIGLVNRKWSSERLIPKGRVVCTVRLVKDACHLPRCVGLHLKVKIYC